MTSGIFFPLFLHEEVRQQAVDRGLKLDFNLVNYIALFTDVTKSNWDFKVTAASQEKMSLTPTFSMKKCPSPEKSICLRIPDDTINLA